MAFSAATGEGIEELLLTIAARLRALTNVVELAVPYDRGDVLAAVHREGEVLSEQADDDGDAAAGAARRRRRSASSPTTWWRERDAPSRSSRRRTPTTASTS